MEMQDTLIIVDGKQITVTDVLVYLKATGVFRDAVCRLVELEVIRNKLPELRIEITEAELYEFAAQKRRFARLERAEEMNEYCRNNGITLAHWLVVTRDELMLQKLRAKVVAESDIAGYFAQNRAMMKTVALSRIVCRDDATAKNVIRRAAAGESFSELARRCSVEENTRHCGGYLGAVRRRMLPTAVDDKVFAARANDVLGPFWENGYWSVYKIEAIREAELGSSLKQEIADRLFKAWLQRAIAASRFARPK
ncbi:MAG: peptidylprolyl isomerase [Planctomycetota bacterium]|nr:peptidylprolyl isomerase [Planctomycetota bacterium]